MCRFVKLDSAIVWFLLISWLLLPLHALAAQEKGKEQKKKEDPIEECYIRDKKTWDGTFSVEDGDSFMEICKKALQKCKSQKMDKDTKLICGVIESDINIISFYANHPWVQEFRRKYFPQDYSYYLNARGAVVEINCGPFSVKYSEDNYKNISIEGNFKLSLNRQIAFIAQKRGFEVSPTFDLSAAFVRYIVETIPKPYFLKWTIRFYNEDEDEVSRKEDVYVTKFIITTLALTNAINSADIKLLNSMIEDFVKNKLTR